MEVLDPGHDYLLRSVDGPTPIRLTFVKRCDPPEKYPGNHNAYPGTQSQEVLRALIDRSLYVDAQQPCHENVAYLRHMRAALLVLESRVRRVRHQAPLLEPLFRIETIPICKECGHILCLSH